MTDEQDGGGDSAADGREQEERLASPSRDQPAGKSGSSAADPRTTDMSNLKRKQEMIAYSDDADDSASSGKTVLEPAAWLVKYGDDSQPGEWDVTRMLSGLVKEKEPLFTRRQVASEVLSELHDRIESIKEDIEMDVTMEDDPMLHGRKRELEGFENWVRERLTNEVPTGGADSSTAQESDAG